MGGRTIRKCSDSPTQFSSAIVSSKILPLMHSFSSSYVCLSPFLPSTFHFLGLLLPLFITHTHTRTHTHAQHIFLSITHAAFSLMLSVSPSLSHFFSTRLTPLLSPTFSLSLLLPCSAAPLHLSPSLSLSLSLRWIETLPSLLARKDNEAKPACQKFSGSSWRIRQLCFPDLSCVAPHVNKLPHTHTHARAHTHSRTHTQTYSPMLDSTEVSSLDLCTWTQKRLDAGDVEVQNGTTVTKLLHSPFLTQRMRRWRISMAAPGASRKWWVFRLQPSVNALLHEGYVSEVPSFYCPAVRLQLSFTFVVL